MMDGGFRLELDLPETNAKEAAVLLMMTKTVLDIEVKQEVDK